MNSRKEIQKIALKKLKDAEQLYKMGCYDNAFYLAGYCIELSLKARICKNMDIDNLFMTAHVKNFKTHEFDVLLMFSGLTEKFNDAKSRNVDLHQNWSYICRWKEDSRYVIVGSKTQTEVLQFLDAIRHPVNGYLKWIKKYW
jgi:uncharacterized protein (UPF0332 family)